MSIAVSAFVRPSRTARCLLAGWGLAQCAAAWAVGLVRARALRRRAAPIAALLAGAGLVLARRGAARPKTHRIDISGTGELRVTVQQDLRTPAVRPAPSGDVAGARRRWPAARFGAVAGPDAVAAGRDGRGRAAACCRSGATAWSRRVAGAGGRAGRDRQAGRTRADSKQPMNLLQRANSYMRRSNGHVQ